MNKISPEGRRFIAISDRICGRDKLSPDAQRFRQIFDEVDERIPRVDVAALFSSNRDPADTKDQSGSDKSSRDSLADASEEVSRT